jgi:hypothetical protein
MNWVPWNIRIKKMPISWKINSSTLPNSLIEALADYPELFPHGILIRWTQEQDLIFEAVLRAFDRLVCQSREIFYSLRKPKS